jgi:hypothetical protein
MKEFRQVAESFNTLAKTYMINRSKPAYKTGNLFNKVGSYNTPDRMLSSKKTKAGNKIKIETPKVYITLNYAPPGAEYGKFVEDGTVYMKKRPFAEEAANDPLLKRQIDNAVNGIVQNTVMNAINIGLKRAFSRLPS